MRSQTQLRRLHIKWGDYQDLSVLGGMTRLEELGLLGASSVREVSALSSLHALRRLEVDSLKLVRDLSALSGLVELQSLEIGGDWMSYRVAHIDSISFLVDLPKLERLVLHTIKVDDLDYSPLLMHPDLRVARVMKVQNMKPSHDELRSAIKKLRPAA